MKFLPTKHQNKETTNKPPEPAKVKVKKTYTLKFYMMILSGASAVIGLALFIIYIITTIKMLGFPSVIMMVAGIFIFNHYRKKDDSLSIEHLDGVKKIVDCNCLNIYEHKIVFENMPNPEGFPMECLNDGKKYYVNIWDLVIKRFVPFVLPDQQYCDPGYLAQRVLGLPAHRRIFERKPKLLQKLKTAFLVIAIGIVWLLILTTTGA